MEDYWINTNYILNKPFALRYSNKPYLMALTGVMHITGVQRLFEEEDVYELIKRMTLFFREQDIIANFFSNDVLFHFKYDGRWYQLKFEHLKSCIGLETLNSVDNKLSFKVWEYQNDISINMYNILMYDLLLGKLELVNLNQKAINDHLISEKKLEFLESDKKKAEFLAKIISQEITSYPELKLYYPNKFKLLKLWREPFVEPIFNYERLNSIQKLMVNSHFKNLKGDDVFNLTQANVKTLTHLAWLYANGYVNKEMEQVCVDKRITKFNCTTLSFLKSNDVESTIDKFNLKILEHFLRDIKAYKFTSKYWKSIDTYSK